MSLTRVTDEEVTFLSYYGFQKVVYICASFHNTIGNIFYVLGFLVKWNTSIFFEFTWLVYDTRYDAAMLQTSAGLHKFCPRPYFFTVPAERRSFLTYSVVVFSRSTAKMTLDTFNADYSYTLAKSPTDKEQSVVSTVVRSSGKFTEYT